MKQLAVTLIEPPVLGLAGGMQDPAMTFHGKVDRRCLINSDIARQIRERLDRGDSVAEIAKAFNLKSGLIRRIKDGLTWKFV